MADADKVNWQTGKQEIIDINSLTNQLKRVDEYAVSPDGDKIAVLGQAEDDTFTAIVNGEKWPESFELAWYLRFTPHGHLTCLARIDDMWTLVVDGKPWENRFEFIWNPQFAKNSPAIALAYKSEFEYGVVVDDKPWENRFQAMRDFTLSPDGKHTAATVQVEPLGEADVFKFFEGVWSVAVDGKAWDSKYINTWRPIFSPDNSSVAAEIRTDIADY